MRCQISVTRMRRNIDTDKPHQTSPSILGFFLLQHIPVTHPRGIALMSKCFHTSDSPATSTSKDRACSLRPGARTGPQVDGNNVGDHNSTTEPEALVLAAPENTVASQVGSSFARWACSSTGDSKKMSSAHNHWLGAPQLGSRR